MAIDAHEETRIIVNHQVAILTSGDFFHERCHLLIGIHPFGTAAEETRDLQAREAGVVRNVVITEKLLPG